MERSMYTFKVRVNGSEPLHKTITVHAATDNAAEAMAHARIIREWSTMYSPGKDTLQLELVSKV